MRTLEKNVDLSISQQIYDQLSPAERKKFRDDSDMYGEFYKDPDQGEMYPGEFTGNNYFSCMSDVFDFAGLEDYDGEYEKLDDVKVYARTFKKFTKEDMKYWYGLAEKADNLAAVFVNGRQIKWRIEEI